MIVYLLALIAAGSFTLGMAPTQDRPASMRYLVAAIVSASVGLALLPWLSATPHPSRK